MLGAASAVALACISTGAFAQQAPIQGGGSTLAEFDYFVEFANFNAAEPANGAIWMNPFINGQTSQDALYWPAGSGSGQAAFLNDDLTCDSNKVLNLTGAGGVVGACSNLPPTAPNGNGLNFVDYGASDATFSSTQIAQWASSTYGQSQAGNLIQLPSMGVGVSFPIVDNGNLQSNGFVTLTDSDLCGIFSGKIQNWNQTSFAGQIPDNQIQVIYRNDGSGTSFLFLNHLSAVCTTANSNFPSLNGKVEINVSTTFTNVFTAPPNGAAPVAIPANFLGEKGSSGIANRLAGTDGSAPPVSATAYLTPDLTTIDPNSNATLTGGGKSPLNVGAVLGLLKNAQGKIVPANLLPTEQNIATGLNNAKSGQFLKPPTSASGFANPNNLVPLIQTVKQGYPVIGYTTFDFAQCYHNPSVGNAIITFLKSDHYQGSGKYATVEINNGFVPLAKSGAKTFIAAIDANILSNTKNYNDNIQNGTVCAGVSGR